MATAISPTICSNVSRRSKRARRFCSRTFRSVSRYSTPIIIDVDAVFALSCGAANSTDVILQTDDRLPRRVSAATTTRACAISAATAFFAGIDYGNLFGLDQHVAYQFTASNDFFSGNPDI